MAALRALILCLDRPLAVEAFCFHRDANWQVRQSLVAKSLAAIFLCKVGGEVRSTVQKRPICRMAERALIEQATIHPRATELKS